MEYAGAIEFSAGEILFILLVYVVVATFLLSPLLVAAFILVRRRRTRGQTLALVVALWLAGVVGYVVVLFGVSGDNAVGAAVLVYLLLSAVVVAVARGRAPLPPS